jgi:nitroreductase
MSKQLKRILQKFLGNSGYAGAAKRVESIKLYLLRRCAKSLLLAKLYVLFSSDYNREIMSTMKGHQLFIKNSRSAENVNYFLRRSVHRLEKGLSTRPRKPVFAVDYIRETVEAYSQIPCDSKNDDEAVWARDVLEKYFEVAGNHPFIDEARNMFYASTHKQVSPSERARKLVPYPKSESDSHSVTYADFLELTKARRSVRYYIDKPVGRDLIDKAIIAASYSPSACNRQPFKFRVFDEREVLSQVVELPGGILTFANNIPVIVAIVGRQRAYPHPKDRHLIYVDGALAAMSFIYALETLGLSSCAINWPDVPQRENRAKQLLQLDDDERIILWVSVGYALPDGMIPYSAKISLENIRSYN